MLFAFDEGRGTINARAKAIGLQIEDLMEEGMLRIEQIDPAFRRRFAYHLELKSPPPGAREGLVRKTLEGVQVSPEFVAKLTERKGLTPAQIRTAVRFAGLAVNGGHPLPGLGGVSL